MVRQLCKAKMTSVGKSSAATFDRLVSELLSGELMQALADQIAEMVAEYPHLEDELLAQVRMHNLLCLHFAGERARQGIPETPTMPKPIDVLVARLQSRRRTPADEVAAPDSLLQRPLRALKPRPPPEVSRVKPGRAVRGTRAPGRRCGEGDVPTK